MQKQVIFIGDMLYVELSEDRVRRTEFSEMRKWIDVFKYLPEINFVTLLLTGSIFIRNTGRPLISYMIVYELHVEYLPVCFSAPFDTYKWWMVSALFPFAFFAVRTMS